MVTDKNEAMFVHICDSGCKDGKHRPIPEAELTTSGGPEIWISTNPNFRVVPNRGGELRISRREIRTREAS